MTDLRDDLDASRRFWRGCLYGCAFSAALYVVIGVIGMLLWRLAT